jgi:hypothetical protein
MSSGSALRARAGKINRGRHIVRATIGRGVRLQPGREADAPERSPTGTSDRIRGCGSRKKPSAVEQTNPPAAERRTRLSTSGTERTRARWKTKARVRRTERIRASGSHRVQALRRTERTRDTSRFQRLLLLVLCAAAVGVRSVWRKMRGSADQGVCRPRVVGDRRCGRVSMQLRSNKIVCRRYASGLNMDMRGQRPPPVGLASLLAARGQRAR